MTLPIKLPPPKDPYNRPARELAGYVASTVDDGEEVGPPGILSSSESITLYAPPAGRGLMLRAQPADVKDYFQLNKVKFDASPYNAARLEVNVFRAGALGARARLYYSTTGQDGSWVEAGVDSTGSATPFPLTCKIDAPGIRVGAGPIIAAAQADVYWAAFWDNGDGTTSPIIGAVFLQFLVATFRRECVWTVAVPPEDMLESGQSIPNDSRWTLTGNVSAFQTGCTAPSCLAMLATFRFGTGAPLDAEATRQFSLAELGAITAGRFARIRGEISWNYLFLTCGPEANPNIRLTVQVNGVRMTTMPSGFPPYDFNWLPFELTVPADSAGVLLGIGIYGDSGICSASLIGGVRNLQIEILDEGSDPSFCVTESVNDPEPALPTDVWDWNPTEGSGTTVTDKNGSGVDVTLVNHGPYTGPAPVWIAPESVRFDHTGIFAFNYGSVADAALTMVNSSQIWYVKMPPAWTEGAWLGGHRGSGGNAYDRMLTLDIGTGKVSAHIDQAVFPFGLQTVTSVSTFGANDEFVVAYTHDGATLRLYINGVEEDSIACGDAASLASPSFQIAGGSPSFSDKEPPSAGGIFGSTGATIGRVVAANRSLTADEVLAFYNAIKAVHTGLP